MKDKLIIKNASITLGHEFKCWSPQNWFYINILLKINIF